MSHADLVSTASGVLANTLGEDVKYIASEGEEVDFKAPFKTDFEEMDMETGAAVMVRKPNILVRHVAMGKVPAINDRFELRGDLYKAVFVDEDMANGESVVLLVKEKQVA